MRYDRLFWVNVGRLFCISFLFIFFAPSTLTKQLHLYVFLKIPFQAFLESYLTHCLDTMFDVCYLSRLFLETVISGGIPTTWNINECFGLQLEGLQRALDYTFGASTFLFKCGCGGIAGGAVTSQLESAGFNSCQGCWGWWGHQQHPYPGVGLVKGPFCVEFACPPCVPSGS